MLEMKHRTDVLDVLRGGKITDEIMETLKTEAENLIDVSYKK